MAGSITPYETAAGRRYRVRYRKANSAQTDKRGFKTKREAETFLASVTIAKAKGDYIDPALSRATVGSIAVTWLQLKRGLKPSYLHTLDRDWRVYVEPRWGHVEVGKILPSDVAAWVQDVADGTAVTKRSARSRTPDGPRSATKVLSCLGILRGILDLAVDDNRISKNPAVGIKGQPKKHSTKVRRYLTHEEVSTLASATGDLQRATVVYTLAYTGLRWGECAGLRVRDRNPLRRRLHVQRNAVEIDGKLRIGPPKSWEKRTVPYPEFLDPLFDALCEGKGPDDPLFSGTLEGLMRRPKTADTSGGWYPIAIARAGLERLTLHDLRHTAASLAVGSGAHVKVVQKMLGHKSAAMTLDTYADLFDGDLDDVATRLEEHGAPHAGAVVQKLTGAA